MYAAPFAAALPGAPAPRGARPRPRGGAVGAVWLAFLAAAGARLTLKDARDESATVHGPGGAHRRRRRRGRRLPGRGRRDRARTRDPGEPILVAPHLTALYTLAERPDPLSADLAAARRAPHGRGRAGRHRRARARRRPVRDHRRAGRSRSTGHTTFGDSFGARARRLDPRQLHTPADTERLRLRAARPRTSGSGGESMNEARRHHWRGRLHRLAPRASACSARASRSSASTTCPRARSRTSRACLEHPGFRFEVPRLHPPARPARGLRWLRRDRAPRGAEDPALRRRAA